MLSLSTLLPIALAGLAACATPYDEYILAPASRTIYPPFIHRVNGTVSNARSLLSPSTTNGSAIFRGNSSVTFDYGKNIGGVVTLTIGSVSKNDNASSSSTAVGNDPVILGITFTESSMWIMGAASDSTADAGLDTPLWVAVDGPGTYTVPREFDRGAFRYLSLTSNSSSVSVEVRGVSVEFTAAPGRELREYTGYFNSDDELLNRIWYAGAYTCQLCSIDPNHGASLVWLNIINSSNVINLPETVEWWNNGTIAQGKTALVDGAKRDRLVWPGDIVVSAPSIFVSTNDMESVRNGLDSLLALQNASGALPYAGSPFQEVINVFSFTYHLHSLLDIALYYEYSNDLGYLQRVWGNFTLGLAYSLGFVDETGLMNVTSSADWLRVGMGGHNIEANAILYHTLNRGIALAAVLNDTASASRWAAAAATVKAAANALLWDADASLYRDNETAATLHPQDGNAWAVLSNLTSTPARAVAVTTALRARWGPYGAPAPEAGSEPATVSPFVGYFELLAHYTTGEYGGSNNNGTVGGAAAAHELLRTQWGRFMLDDPRMTRSTFIEGYSADGSLHYAPYTNDARVSHAHGWSTGPTSALTFWTAGLRATGSLKGAAAGGWVVAPRLGGLGRVAAGYEAALGRFAVEVEGGKGKDGEEEMVTALWFSTPRGTVGEVSLPGVEGVLRSDEGEEVALVDGEAAGVPGGDWTLVAA